MQIVIDIPEGLKDVFENRNVTALDVEVMRDAIKNGTPLPKRHGDLIDKNALLDCSYEIDSMYCEYDKVVKVDDIKDAPTIIEAEKGDGT